MARINAYFRLCFRRRKTCGVIVQLFVMNHDSIVVVVIVIVIVIVVEIKFW
jgi:hypothetical protein